MTVEVATSAAVDVETAVKVVVVTEVVWSVVVGVTVVFGTVVVTFAGWIQRHTDDATAAAAVRRLFRAEFVGVAVALVLVEVTVVLDVVA